MYRFLPVMRSLAITIFLLTSICTIALYYALPSLLAKNLSTKLDTHVHIGDVVIRLDSFSIFTLHMQNIKKSILPTALSVDTIHIKSPLTQYLKNAIIIDTISLDNIYLGLEFDSAKGTSGNWTELVQHLQNSSSPSNTTLKINKLVLTNLHVEVAYKDTGVRKKLPLIPEIILTNITSEEGLPSEQIMKSVVGQMLKSVFIKENLRNMIDGLLPHPTDTIDSLLQPLRKLFGMK